jgi:hypothetical protein
MMTTTALRLILAFSWVPALTVTTIATPVNPQDGLQKQPSINGKAPGPGPQQAQVTKVAQTVGDWSFDVITSQQGAQRTVSSTLTYYAGKSKKVVVVPSVLGGAPVTAIAAQAFGHHGEILAVYVPDSVQTIADWAFYDLNAAALISCANPDVHIADGAFQSSGNATLYLPATTQQKQAGGKNVVTGNTEPLQVTVTHPEAAAVAGGNYLSVINPSDYRIVARNITLLAQAASGKQDEMAIATRSVSFTGKAYVAKPQTVVIADVFRAIMHPSDLNQTLHAYTAAQAEQQNIQLAAKDSGYSDVASRLYVHAGYYLNGSPVTVATTVKAYDVSTGKDIKPDAKTRLYPSTGTAQYKYVAGRDTNQDGALDVLYYSPYARVYTSNTVKISSKNKYLNGLAARDVLNPIYLAFANAVLSAQGESVSVHKRKLNLATATDGDLQQARENQNRSILWASDYGSIQVDQLQAKSTSTGNWAQMSYQSGLPAYNVELVMEWGMNALLYATNGGTIRVGQLKGPQSTFTATGDGANGIIAGAAGKKAGRADAPEATSSVAVYNARFDLQGWNNHVADTVYGGYVSMEKIHAVTGKPGSYAVGQSSALANDFGNGVVEARDFHTTVYGNRSAGAYVIGGGVITADDSSFTSEMDAGLVAASGGTYHMTNSTITGQIALRNRGGLTPNATSDFQNTRFVVDRSVSGYTVGDRAQQAVQAWQQASGDSALMHYLMSDPAMTLGTLCQHYQIAPAATSQLIQRLGQIAGKVYTPDTPLRNSVLDNTYYNYSAGHYVGDTDFSAIPYLTIGSAFGGLTAAALEFEGAGMQVQIRDSKLSNHQPADYRYLISSEAGSAPVVTFRNTPTYGIVWNEGTVNRMVEGRPGDRNSSLTVHFIQSKFTGSFADGSNGLWNVEHLSYTNGQHQASSLNGNYYGASANWGIHASFDAGSTWSITHDSYFGSLMLSPGFSIITPKGYTAILDVNGQRQPMNAGTYQGQVRVLLIQEQPVKNS